MANVSKTYAVFGLGIFGMEVALELQNKGGKVIVIEKDSKKIDKLKNIVDQAMAIDCTDKDSMDKVPLDGVDVAIVSIADDIQSSILTTALLKQHSIPYIISRAANDIHARILREIGANEVINVEVEMGKRVANQLINPNIIEDTDIGGNFAIAQIRVPEGFVGKNIKDLDIRNKHNVNIILVKSIAQDVDELGNPKPVDFFKYPDPAYVFEDTDTLLIIGEKKDIEKVKDMYLD